MNPPVRYLVKAVVARQGQCASARYIPLDIFELWKSHMSAAYGYQVSLETIGSWTSDDHGSATPPDLAGSEAVAEVTVLRRNTAIEDRAVRFFPQAELGAILPRFLAHYGIDPADPASMALVSVTPGHLSIAVGNQSA